MHLDKHFCMNFKGSRLTRFFGLVFFFVLSSGLLYSQTSPTVTLTDTDADNLLSASDTVTITATFSEAMVATPTISITGVVTDVGMIPNPDVLLFSSATASNTSATVTNTYAQSYEGINFGTVVKISADGSTLVTNSHYGKTIYIYKKSNGGWNLKQKIHGSDKDTDGTYTASNTIGAYWGLSFDVSGDGNTIVVTNSQFDGDMPYNGETLGYGGDTFMIYEYSGILDKYEFTFETLEFSSIIPFTARANEGRFSIYNLSLSDDGGTLVGVRPNHDNDVTKTIFYVIDINNLGTNSISVTSRQAIEFDGLRDYNGRVDIQISGDGLTFVVKGSGGKLLIYTRTDLSSNFSLAQTIDNSSNHSSDMISDVAINYDGEFIVWSTEESSVGWPPTIYQEQVIVYKRDSGTGTWSKFGSTITDPGSDGRAVHFGRSIDISGNGKYLFVATPAGTDFDDPTHTESNKVYSYKYTNSGFVYNSVVYDQLDPLNMSMDVSLSKSKLRLWRWFANI
jgi:hypothetical protein